MENPDDAGGAEAPPVFPGFILTEERTPAEIVAWWDELVAVFTAVATAADARVAALDAELNHLKGARGIAERCRVARLRTERTQRLAAAEAVEFEAYGLFEGTLSEFSPRLIQMLQAEGMAIPDDDEMAVAVFWDCLQRPAIEHCAHLPLRQIARDFARDCRF